MKVVVRAGLPGKYVIEADGKPSIEVDASKSLYEGLHAIKEPLAAWFDDAPATEPAPEPTEVA